MASLQPRPFAVQLWNGEEWPPEPAGPADFKLIFRTPEVVRGIFSNVSALSFGEAHVYDGADDDFVVTVGNFKQSSRHDRARHDGARAARVEEFT